MNLNNVHSSIRILINNLVTNSIRNSVSYYVDSEVWNSIGNEAYNPIRDLVALSILEKLNESK